MPQNAVCAEIGVWKGEFSDHVVRQTNPSRYVLIDPWAFQSEFPNRMFGGTVAKSQADMDAIHTSVAERFSSDRFELVRKMSLDAAKDFADETFDWVYIDGNHYYDYVRQDLDVWLPKVKPGGFLTGDDYLWLDDDRRRSVALAVSDFVECHAELELMELGNQFILSKP